MDRKIYLWDAKTLEAKRGVGFVGHRDNVTGIVFWNDGESLISSDAAGDVIMWDVSTRRPFARLGGPADDVTSLDVSETTATLLASSEDDAVWAWTLDPAEWRALACQLAGRNMTQIEWQRYGDGTARVRHCPQWGPAGGDVRDASYSSGLAE